MTARVGNAEDGIVQGKGSQGEHPRFALEPTLSHPVRFSIVAALAAVESLPFGDLRDELAVSDSVLSKQIAELETGGLVRAAKSFVGKRPRTTLSLTADGLRRWKRHLEAMRAIVGDA
ncbi:transcriptional regulator [Brachybacterium nesterenkovii]|uniref:Winged helix DNA-binding domain-containing protein n=1 Tax=Brachybacterium nesterenkovii TaxID=47847 RepID=A0A1X6WWA5_9MICO|nr:transcriptional regulator [Brachybacterium nesterenkovii]SLM89881.1 hypothetical protein FM110_04270 [Brachybacterium nesterenkovii]